MKNKVVSKVLKRDGTYDDIDFSKIKNVIRICSEKIAVEFPEFESFNIQLEASISNIHYISELTTEKIQQMVIANCSNLYLESGNIYFSKLGAQLLLYNIEKEYLKEIGRLNSDHRYDLKHFINHFITKGYYDDEQIGVWGDDELKAIEKFLNFNYDKDFEFHQVALLSNKYQVRNAIESIEPPQLMNIVQAMCLAKNQDDRVKKVEEYYNALASHSISLATPFRNGLRREKNLTSCFIIEADDDSDSILDCIRRCALYSKNGGGVGVYLGKIRPSNSKIKGIRRANNINVWMKIFDCIAPAWNQNGVRKGAFTISLDIFHKDIISFINVKSEAGSDVNERCFNIFPQVIINAEFIEEVKNDGMFPLCDRREILEQFDIDICKMDEWKSNYKMLKDEIEKGNIQNCSLISAKKLWIELLKVYIETGELFLSHKDNMNKFNPLANRGMFINSANLCTESYSPVSKNIDHSCNLISINVAKLNLETIGYYSKLAVEMLNIATDDNKFNIFDTQKNSKFFIKPIGVGIMGVADYMVNNSFTYKRDSAEIEKIFETVAYFTLQSSVNMAKNSNSTFKLFRDSSFASGVFLGKTAFQLQSHSICGYDWKSLIAQLKIHGAKNCFLTAIAPNTSTSILCGCTPNIIPIFEHKVFETFSDFSILIARDKRYELYRDVGVVSMIELVEKLSHWVDAGISLELNINENDDISGISNALLSEFSKNLKNLYYARVSRKASDIECVSCQN